MFVGCLADKRHLDWGNSRLGQEIHFLDRAFDTEIKRPDPSLVKSLLNQAERSDGQQLKLARVWAAIRLLMGVPYTVVQHPEYLRLWDQALGRWASHAAWYGMHAHLFLGHQAALGSLMEVRRRLISVQANGHTASADGALASCYYSLSKIAPRAQRGSFLERAALYVDQGLAMTTKTKHSGLCAIRGSINLLRGMTTSAIEDYEAALRLIQPGIGSESRAGSLLTELGWAELRTGRFSEGLAHLRQGVALMKQVDGGPGFLVRGQRKLAYGLAICGHFPSSFRELREANEIANIHQLEDQINLPMRMAGSLAEILSEARNRLR